MKPSKVKIYFSFRSPYSWFGTRLLEKKGLGPASKLPYVPFFEPDATWAALLRERNAAFPYSAMSRDKHYYVLQDVKRLARIYGVPLRWPIDENPDWSVPHVTYLACRRRGLGAAFFWSVYRERWEKGTNVWLWETMESLLRQLDTDAGAMLRLARSREITEAATEALCEASDDGVFGVPFFIHNREKFWGVDRLDLFLDSLGADFCAAARVEGPSPYLTEREGSAATVAGTPPDLAPLAEDHAGGCG